MKARIILALALAGTLGGCGIFKGSGSKPKTAVLGERLPVLASETDAEVDPALAGRSVALPPATANADWPQPGGTASKSLGNPAFAGTLARAWTAHIPKSSPKARFGAGPVVAGGRLYVIDTQAVVHAFAADTGARVWEAPAGGEKEDRQALFGGGVSFDDGRLYATNGLGDVVALDAATGKQLWKKRPGGPLRGAPTVAIGTVLVVSQDNQMYALSTADGATMWTDSATLEASGVFGVAAPAVAQGTVVAGFSSGELSALRYENGRVVWQDQLARTSISTSVASISDVDASPVIDSGRVYAIGQGGRMVAMGLTSGQRLWEIGIGGGETPWLAGDWLFVVSDQAKLFCISRDTGKVRWITQLQRWTNAKRKTNTIEWSGPVLAGGSLYLVSSRGQMVRVSATDGTMGTPVKAGKEFHLAPIVANGMLLTLDSNGTLSAWR